MCILAIPGGRVVWIVGPSQHVTNLTSFLLKSFSLIYFIIGPFERMEGFTFSVHKELIRHFLLAKILLVFG